MLSIESTKKKQIFKPLQIGKFDRGSRTGVPEIGRAYKLLWIP